MKYRAFAALYEEATAGWVWIADPKVAPHRIVVLRNRKPGCHRAIYCEARTLDKNFVQFYNGKPHTAKIDENNYNNVLVVGDWYRQALGITGTQTEVELAVRQPRIPFWSAMRAGSQHRDPTVRLANRLGLLGTWLGLFGLVGAIVPIQNASWHPLNLGAGLWLMLCLAGIGCIWGIRGVRWSKNPCEIQTGQSVL